MPSFCRSNSYLRKGNIDPKNRCTTLKTVSQSSSESRRGSLTLSQAHLLRTSLHDSLVACPAFPAQPEVTSRRLSHQEEGDKKYQGRRQAYGEEKHGCHKADGLGPELQPRQLPCQRASHKPGDTNAKGGIAYERHMLPPPDNSSRLSQRSQTSSPIMFRSINPQSSFQR